MLESLPALELSVPPARSRVEPPDAIRKKNVELDSAPNESMSNAVGTYAFQIVSKGLQCPGETARRHRDGSNVHDHIKVRRPAWRSLILFNRVYQHHLCSD